MNDKIKVCFFLFFKESWHQSGVCWCVVSSPFYIFYLNKVQSSSWCDVCARRNVFEELAGVCCQPSIMPSDVPRPSALSLLCCPFSLHALCSLRRLRSEPSCPPFHPQVLPPTLLDRHQVPQMSHLLPGHAGLSTPSNPRPPSSPSGRMCPGLGLCSARASQTHTSSLRGEESSNIVACRQLAATSHHIVNNLFSYWSYGTCCRARCMSEVHMCVCRAWRPDPCGVV